MDFGDAYRFLGAIGGQSTYWGLGAAGDTDTPGVGVPLCTTVDFGTTGTPASLWDFLVYGMQRNSGDAVPIVSTKEGAFDVEDHTTYGTMFYTICGNWASSGTADTNYSGILYTRLGSATGARSETGDGVTTTEAGGPGGVGTLTDTRQNWRTNQWPAGGTVTCNGETLTIASNDGDTILGTGAWSGDPGDGNAYTIANTVLVGDVRIALLCDDSENEHYFKAQVYHTGAWNDVIGACGPYSDSQEEMITLKADFNTGGNPALTLYRSIGAGIAQIGTGADANITQGGVTSCVDYGHDGGQPKNAECNWAIFSMTIYESNTTGDTGLDWDTGDTPDTKEWCWDRVPRGDVAGGDWSAFGGDANCPTVKWRGLDDPYDDDNQANDGIDVTLNGEPFDERFTIQALDGAADPLGVYICLVARDVTKVGNYQAHWKVDGVEYTKALVAGFKNTTDGTTYYAWLPTQTGVQGGAAWTHALTEAAEFGVRLVNGADYDGAIYGVPIGILGNNFGMQTDASACVAAGEHVRQGVAIGSANAMHFKADPSDLGIPIGGCCS